MRIKTHFQGFWLQGNAFTCEAHNELITTYLRMICDDRVKFGKQQIPRIEKLQKGVINVWEE